MYKVCKKCIMDTTDPSIKFNSEGICSHCLWFEERGIGQLSYSKLLKKIESIKEKQKNNKYDVIVGLSGGVDSSYLLYYCVKEFGLRPLVVHCDNGWNSEPAVYNIEQLIRKLDVDFYTYIIDWEEFVDIQKAFFKSGVIDLEVVSDHALNAIILKSCEEFNTPCLISGSNYQTESILPRDWAHDKLNFNLVKNICTKYGINQFKSYPYISIEDQRKLTIEVLRPLNHMPYDKEKAKEILKNNIGWKDYGTKHGESIFTKFYQNYILPNKFNIDKRKAHYSSMILSGLITRTKALKLIKKPLYDKIELRRDKKYILKKLKFTRTYFENYINDKNIVLHKTFLEK